MSRTDAAAVSSAPLTPFPLKLRLYVMMFLQYFVQGCYLPIIAVYLQDALNFDSTQVGWFISALAVGPLVAPFIVGQLVDRHFATQYVLAFCHLAAGGLMLALYFQVSFWPVVVLGTLYSMLYVPTMMLTNSLTFHHLRARDREFPLVRLWGTVGFIVPAWVIELIFLDGLSGQELNTARGVALALSGVVGLVMGVYALSLPHTPPSREARTEFAPGKVVGLLRYRNFLALVLISFLIAIVHNYFFVWNSPYLKVMLERGGISGAEQRMSSIGQISEIAVMAGLGLLILRVGFKRTLAIGAAAYTLRCIILALAIALEGLPFAAAITLVGVGQALHGLCFGCFLATAYMYVDRVSPLDVRGSMQNIYGTFVVGAGFVAGGFVAGRVGKWFSHEAGQVSLRDQLGIATDAGLAAVSDRSDALIRDWPGIWLSSAALAGLALVALLVFFPRDTPAPTGGASPD